MVHARAITSEHVRLSNSMFAITPRLIQSPTGVRSVLRTVLVSAHSKRPILQTTVSMAAVTIGHATQSEHKPLNDVFTGLPTTIFTVMTNLAIKHQTINLGQGFPDEV